MPPQLPLTHLCCLLALAALCAARPQPAAGVAAAAAAPLGRRPHAAAIRHVDLVFSNHFDAGFAGIRPDIGLDNAVIDKYFK